VSPSPAPGAGASSSGGGGSGQGWWWLVGVLVVGGGLATFLLVRRARGVRAWEEQLSGALDEVGWFARDLVPQLRRTGSPEGVVAGWSVGAPRVTALEDRLSELASTAPGDERRVRATTVRDAVREAREQMTTLVAEGARDWPAGLDAAQAPLLATLVPPPEPDPRSGTR